MGGSAPAALDVVCAGQAGVNLNATVGALSGHECFHVSSTLGDFITRG